MLDLPPSIELDIVGQTRRRREYHGIDDHIVVNRTYVDDWVPRYRDAAHRMQCGKEVRLKFEPLVAKYGYSLEHPLRLQTTPLIQQYLLVP